MLDCNVEIIDVTINNLYENLYRRLGAFLLCLGNCIEILDMLENLSLNMETSREK